MPDSPVYNPVAKVLTKAAQPRRLRVHVCKSGERFPIVEGPDGLPDHEVCTFAAAILRPHSGSVNTMLQALRGPMALKAFADARSIDLSARIRDGVFLHLHEQTGLDAFLSSRGDAGPATRSRRMRSALVFMKWKWRRRAAALAAAPATRAHYLTMAHEFREEFESVIPPSVRGGPRRVGLSDAGRKALVEFLGDDAAIAAVWTDHFVAARNVFLFKSALLLGHRVGEYLSMTVNDLDLEKRQYTIRRNHDSVDDPRVHQPLVKGFQRDLHWPALLVPDARSYLRKRGNRPYAPETAFLFVTRDGSPLSRSMVAKVFSQLHWILPALGERFSPHVLRHTWNEMFSEVADRRGIPEEKEIRARMLAMGWTNRATAKFYTARADKRAADDISVGIQDMLVEMSGGEW